MYDNPDYILKNMDLLTASIEDETARDAMSSIIIMAKKRKVLEVHPYKINLLPDGRFQTWVKLKTGKLKEIRKPTEDQLFESLHVFYFGEPSRSDKKQSRSERYSLNNLYVLWLQKKSEITESRNTIIRHKQHYAKYFQDTELFRKDIRKITIDELEVFCNQLVRENHLTSKEWTNIKIIPRGIFELAMRQQIITSNVFESVRITVRFRQEKHKPPSDEILTAEERDSFFSWLWGYYNRTHDAAYLAPLIEYYTGARIGEIVAFKWPAIKGNNIHISEEETYNYETHVYSVVPHTKGHRDRYVGLITSALDVFDTLLENEKTPNADKYIFQRNGKRLTAREVTYVYELYAKEKGVPVKRSHKLRKTFASVLDSKGVSLEIIRNQLGHRDIATTMRYIYNPCTDDETIGLMDAALT